MLAAILDATIGPPGYEVATSAAKLASVIEELGPSDREALIAALDCDQDAFLAERGERQTYLGPQVIRAAIREVCQRQLVWTEELALHVFAACRQARSYDELGGLKTLSAMERSDVQFSPSEKRDREFAGLSNAFGDVGKWGEIRRAVHRLFDRVYVPRLVSSHSALSDEPFQAYLQRLVDGLRHVAMVRERVRTLHPEWYAECSGQLVRPEVFAALRPEMHPFKTFQFSPSGKLGQVSADRVLAGWKWWFPFRNPDLIPIDEAWISHASKSYQRWEDEFGDARWIEHLIPCLPAEFTPKFAHHCSSSTGSKPSPRWLKGLAALCDEKSDLLRSCVLIMLRSLGSATLVRSSEAAWKGAIPYAYLHLEYLRLRDGGYSPATISLPELHRLPWIREGQTLLENPLPTNPIALSETNTAFGRGLIWAAANWADGEMVEGIATAAGGAMQHLHLDDVGPRLRSLALLNACVWSLKAIGSAQAQLALSSLARDATDARVRRSIAAAL